MILYPIYNEICTMMQKTTALTPHLLKTSGKFYEKTCDFVAQLVKLSENSNLYITADLSVCLDKLLTYNPKKDSQNIRVSSAKDKDRFAVEILQDVVRLTNEFLKKPRETFSECEDIWRQVLARILAKGVTKDHLPKSNQERLATLLELVKSDTELSPYYSHILGLSGEANARVLLDITMPSVNL
ncbi:MAG: hypothetical protein R3Y32_09195 [Bacillota bacterium]